jgi:DNA polymerase-3 subunit alpha
MREALVQMKPNHIEDIIALVALYRPGPMSNIPIYNDCKHGKQTPDYLHPLLEDILKPTYGVNYLSRTGNANCSKIIWFYCWSS